jgi:hypothetical protein
MHRLIAAAQVAPHAPPCDDEDVYFGDAMTLFLQSPQFALEAANAGAASMVMPSAAATAILIMTTGPLINNLLAFCGIRKSVSSF